MKIPRKCYNREAKPSRGTKRRGDEQAMTKQTPHMKPPMCKEELILDICWSQILFKLQAENFFLLLKQFLVVILTNIVVVSCVGIKRVVCKCKSQIILHIRDVFSYLFFFFLGGGGVGGGGSWGP